jgi:hypothetical protein
MIQHEAVVIRLGEGGSLLAEVAGFFSGCRDCSGEINLSLGQMPGGQSDEHWFRTRAFEES